VLVLAAAAMSVTMAYFVWSSGSFPVEPKQLVANAATTLRRTQL
jgi:hypothetical protein